MNNESASYPIVCSETEPSIDPLGLVSTGQFRWHNLKNGRTYKLVDSKWIVIGETGVNVDITDNHVKIVHIKVMDGIITELETE